MRTASAIKTTPKQVINKVPRKRKTMQAMRPLTHKDTKSRFFSFMADVIIMLSPVMIWNIIMLAVLGSLVSISGMFLIDVVIGILLIISILFANCYVQTKTNGQSFGMFLYNLKVVKKSMKKASRKQLIFREVVGFGLPFIALMLFFNILGVIAYWLLNGLIVLVDPKHRSLIDFIAGTRVVALVQKEEMVSTNVEPVEEKQVVQPKPAIITSTIDLHIHSNFSANGKYNIEEIFQNAKAKGLKTISITDHDSAKGNAIAARMSEMYKVNYVPGIEINCDLKGRRVRILGYFIEYTSDLYAHIENESLVNEKFASIERTRAFEDLIGMPINVNRLLENNRFQRISGEMIAEYVLTRPEYKQVPLLQPYLRGQKSGQPYRSMAKDFFAYGGMCYVPVKYPKLQDVLDVIGLTNGIAVIAHPGKLLSQSPDLLDEVLDLGVQGIEVFHPMHTKREMTELLKIATEHKLFVTAGSDYYGTNRQNSEIGYTNCPKEAESLVKMLVNAKI